MKALHWIIATITGAILTLVITAWLASPINNYFRSDRLVGTMELGPMKERPLPVEQKASDEPKSAEQLLDEISEGLRNFARRDGSTFANLTLENNSDKVVSNIRFRFDDYRADVLLDREEDAKDVFHQGVQQFDVPDMAPGDTLTYRLWINTSSPEYVADNLKSYSSSGAVRLRFSWPETMAEFPEDGIEKAMDDWGYMLVFILMMLLLFILMFVSHSYEELVKKFFKDEALFEEHRRLFDADPKKYNPFQEIKGAEAPEAKG